MRVLVPINLVPIAGMGTSISPEDQTPIWVSGTSYSVGQEVHRTQTHRVYRCAVATSGTIPPEQAITSWVDIRPTSFYAPFDYYTSTKSTGFNYWSFYVGSVIPSIGISRTFDINLRGVEGATKYHIAGVRKGTPGVPDTTVWTLDGFLQQPINPGWYEYLFLPQVNMKSLTIKSPYGAGAIDYISVNFVESFGNDIKVGSIIIGEFENFGPDNIAWSCNRGASVEPTTFSFIKTEEDGTVTIQKRASATNLRLASTFPIDYANSVAWRIEDLLDTPVLVAGGSEQQIEGLSTFGLISGSVSYDYTTATAEISVKGLP